MNYSNISRRQCLKHSQNKASSYKHYSRQKIQTADGNNTSAVQVFKSYSIRLYVQTAMVQKNHQIFLPSGNRKTSRSHIQSILIQTAMVCSKNHQKFQTESALRLYIIYLQYTFPDGNPSPYYYVIENQRVLLITVIEVLAARRLSTLSIN